MNSILKIWLLLLIFTTPLIIPFGDYGYEQAKVVVFIVGVEVLSALWLLKNILYQQTSFNLSITKILGLFFILALTISTGLGENWQASLFGTEPYYQGLILYIFLYLFFLLVSVSGIRVKEVAVMIFLSSTVVSCLAISDWVLLNIYQQNILNYAGRPISTFGQPNFYSGFLSVSLPLLLVLPNIFLLLGVLVSGSAILLSGSRIAVALLGAVIVFMLIVKFQRLRSSYLVYLVTILALIAIPLLPVLLSSQVYKEFCQPLFYKWVIEDSPEKRVFIWPIIIDLIKARPWFGHGLENLSASFSSYPGFFDIEAKPAYFHSLKNLIIDRSHNYSLDLWFFAGALGIGSWLLIFWYGLSKAKNLILIFTLLVYFVWAQIQNQSVVNLMLFWLLLGLIDQKGVDS